jgi:long-chain acyl-CoA synthetase
MLAETMPFAPTTLLNLVEQGWPLNRTGICAAVKRNGTWIETTCTDFRAKVRHLALGLYALGVRKGDRVALHAENSTEWLITDQAILSLGAVNVPIYTTQPGDQIRFILNDAAAMVYIVSRQPLFDAFAPFLAEVPSLRATIGLLGSYHPEMQTLELVLHQGQVLDDREAHLFDDLRASVHPDDLASFIYTSGTTGMPKGVMLTHNNIAANVQAACERLPFTPADHPEGRMLSYLPLSHIFERMMVYMYSFIGRPVWFTERFEEVVEDMKTVQPIHFSTVPRLLEKVYLGIHSRAATLTGVKRLLMDEALRLADAYDVEQQLGPVARLRFALADRLVLSKIRTNLFGPNLLAITSGGAALPARIMNFINALGVFCAQGYGLTESSPVITFGVKGKLRAGSSGLPLSNVEVRIAPDGEILARGPNVMVGYYHRPEETREVLDEDGWLHTGDIGHLDADGHLFITDRKKALFKLSTGKYVAPQPIENALTGTPFVDQAVVIGNGQKFCAALIVPNEAALRARLRSEGQDVPDGPPSAQPLFSDLIWADVKTLNEQLPPWEQVKKIYLLDHPFTIESGELTPKLSIKRKVVQDKYSAVIDSLYG